MGSQGLLRCTSVRWCPPCALTGAAALRAACACDTSTKLCCHPGLRSRYRNDGPGSRHAQQRQSLLWQLPVPKAPPAAAGRATISPAWQVPITCDLVPEQRWSTRASRSCFDAGCGRPAARLSASDHGQRAVRAAPHRSTAARPRPAAPEPHALARGGHGCEYPSVTAWW